MNSILEDAIELLNGDRQDEYGDAEGNYDKIALLFNAMADYDLDGKDVCLIMVLTKLVREMHKHKRDNLVDAAAYISFMGGEDETCKDESSLGHPNINGWNDDMMVEEARDALAGVRSNPILAKLAVDRLTSNPRNVTEAYTP